MRRQIDLFFTALMFFTYLPCPTWVEYSEDHLNHASRYFPLVGIVVGLIGAVVFWLSHWLWPLPIALLLSMLSTIVVTGAFHEDGWADCCDGFGGGWSTEQVLTIMKDSRLGTFGVGGLGLMLALKFTTLHEFDPKLIPFMLIAGHSLSRWASVTLLYTHTYARQDLLTKAKPLAQQMTSSELLIATITGLAPLILLNYWLWLTLIPVWLTRWIMGRYFMKRLGGYTGDCLGGVQQVTEIVFYLIALLLI